MGEVFFWVVTVVVSLVVSITANLWTPPVKNFFAKTSYARASRRVRQLELELARVEAHEADLVRFVVRLIGRVAFLIVYTMMAVVVFILATEIALEYMAAHPVRDKDVLSGILSRSFEETLGLVKVSLLDAGGLAYGFGLIVLLRAVSIGLWVAAESNRVLGFERYVRETRETVEKLRRSFPVEVPPGE